MQVPSSVQMTEFAWLALQPVGTLRPFRYFAAVLQNCSCWLQSQRRKFSYAEL